MNPVYSTAIGGLVASVLTALVAFNVSITQAQQVAILGVIGALSAVVTLVVGLIEAQKHANAGAVAAAKATAPAQVTVNTPPASGRASKAA